MSSPVPSQPVDDTGSRVSTTPAEARGRSPGLLLEVPSDPAALAGVRRAVEAFAARAGFDSKAVGEIGLCVNEAMANVIRHAYRGTGSRPIQVTADYGATGDRGCCC